jgi:N-acyl-D-aspartate/D-glutamate deacylase
VRVLGHFARDRRLLTLEEAVYKMTGLPAQRFGLADRGLLAAGMVADVVVFDFDRVADGATYDDPLRPPQGVRHVLVNGRVAVRDGEPTGERAGRFLTRTAS